MEDLDQRGYLANMRYKAVLTKEYGELYREAIKQSDSVTWGLLADRGREFPLVVEEVSSIDLKKASAADIGILITYFGYRNKGIEEILENITYERIKLKISEV